MLSRHDCESARALASLALDVELSELERSALAAHLRRCADCARFQRDIAVVTDALRTAEHEAPAARPQVRRARRPGRLRRGALVASALAAACGLGVLAAGSRSEHTAPAPRPQLLAQRSLGWDALLLHSERQPHHQPRWPNSRLL